MSLTLSELRHLAYDDPVIGPALGFYGTATSVTALALTDPDNFGNTRYGRNHFAGKGVVVLPGRLGTDREKQAGQITGDVLSLDDAVNYTASFTNEPYEFLQGGHGPEAISFARVNTAAQNALRSIYFDTREALSQLFADGGLNRDDLDAWAASSTAADITIEKSAALDHNLPGGLYSLLATYITANQYVSAANPYGAQAGDQLWIAAVPILLNWGTASLKVWDVTHNRQIGQTLAVTGLGAYHLGAQFAVTSACELNIRLSGEAGMQIAWDSLPNHDIEGVSFLPPEWVSANWMLHGIDETIYGRSVSQGAERAASAQPQRWQPRIDYALSNMSEDSSPGLIQVMSSVHQSLPGHDLFFYGQRRESDRSELTDETQTTNADQDFLLAAFFSELCEMLEGRDHLGPQGTWAVMKREQDGIVAAQRMARSPAAPQPRRVHRTVVV